MVAAREAVRSKMGVSMSDLFAVLRAATKTRRLRAGHGVLYGEKTCVMRNGDTSWPFSVVRRTHGGSWICLSCRTGDGTCDHVNTAVAAAKAVAEECNDSTDADVEEEDEQEEARLLASAGLNAAAADDGNGDLHEHEPVSGATPAQLGRPGAKEVPPHLPRAAEAVIAVNRFKWSSRSSQPRHLVPPRVAQMERTDLMHALRDSSQKLHYPAGPQCPFCRVERTPQTRIVHMKCKVEF